MIMSYSESNSWPVTSTWDAASLRFLRRRGLLGARLDLRMRRAETRARTVR